MHRYQNTGDFIPGTTLGNVAADLYLLYNTAPRSSHPTTLRVVVLYMLVSCGCCLRNHYDVMVTLIRPRGEEENDQIHHEIGLVIRMRGGTTDDRPQIGWSHKGPTGNGITGDGESHVPWLYLAIDGIYETYRRSLRPKETLIDSLSFTVKDAYEKFLSRVPQESTNALSVYI
jgi:hypothetical protein